MIYCSFGNGLRLTGDPEYKEVIVEAARSLSTRFRPVAGLSSRGMWIEDGFRKGVGSAR